MAHRDVARRERSAKCARVPWSTQPGRGCATWAATSVPPGAAAQVRLVKGSHIVVPRITGANDAYLCQSADGRVVFAIPYEERFTLIGTTEIAYDGDPGSAAISGEEEEYLLALARQFFASPPARDDIVWSYAGVRPLYDDDSGADASSVTRDYRFELSEEGGAPLLTVLGGKLTTYRRLAEAALGKLAPYFPGMGRPWTASSPLPGGDLGEGGLGGLHQGPVPPPSRLRSGVPRAPGAALRHDGRRCAGRGGKAGRPRRRAGRRLDGARGRLSARSRMGARAGRVLWRRTKCGLHIRCRGSGPPLPTEHRAPALSSASSRGWAGRTGCGSSRDGAGAYRGCRPGAVHVDDLALLQLQRADARPERRRSSIVSGRRRRPPAPCRGDRSSRLIAPSALSARSPDSGLRRLRANDAVVDDEARVELVDGDGARADVLPGAVGQWLRLPDAASSLMSRPTRPPSARVTHILPSSERKQALAGVAGGRQVDRDEAAALHGRMAEHRLHRAADVGRLELGLHAVAGVGAAHVDADLAAAARAVVDLELGDVGEHLAVAQRHRRGAAADGQRRQR